MSTVGWIGLGVMGLPMARVVAQAGHSVQAFDIDRRRLAALADDGVVPVTSAAEAAAGADVLTIMVATPEQGESALFGAGGAAEGLGPGTVVLVMSTVGPAAVAEWEARLSGQGVPVVDAPVSGGVARAATGELLIMVSGAPGPIEAVAPLLDAMSSTAPVVGNEPGDGQKLKLVNQLLCGVHIVAAAEALVLAESMGLDVKNSWEVLRNGAAASFMFDDRGRRMVEASFDNPRSALDIFVKDMGLVVEAAQRSKAGSPLAQAAQSMFRAGAEAGYGRLDDSSVLLVYEELLRQRAGQLAEGRPPRPGAQ
ncbi:MAG TPA: NAD(P)-dependent oxidoreductase [Acidimicrobiales bacterium]|nr:NAD(P)-dependent oxidoreductase [Acidimicrobiales bacterium]